MDIKIKKKFLGFLLYVVLIGTIFSVNSVAAEKDVYALTYHVGAYDMFPESNGSISVMIDGKKYYYSDNFDDGEIATKISKMENQNVVYELHDNKIVKVYTMDEVLSQEVTVEPSVKDGLIYRKGKFSQKSFELVVKVSNNLQGDFKKNDLLWFLSETEKDCLYSTLKKLEIKPSNEVDFGSSGWWMWKEYEKTISENMNDVIRADETKEYKYTVNLHNDGVVNQPKYDISIYAAPTFDTGVGRRAEGKIQVGNLDYQEEKTEEKKATSNAGKSVAQAATTLDGIQNAIQFSNDLFSADQTDQINEFVNIWMSELLLAKYVDKSDLKEKVSEKIANELLKKLGLDTSVLTIPGEIRATTYLETQTKDGSRAFIQFNIDLMNFDFGNSGMPTMATGSGTAIVYNMDGEELNSSVILPVYANVCAFCEQLQQVAKDTIFNGAKEYLGIFGKNEEATAEALSSKMMEKILNSKYAKKAFKRVDAKDVKAVLKKIIVGGEKKVNNKIFELVTTPSKESTEVSVKCPVDVKIYDNDGNLCGVVKDNVVDSTYDDIFVTVVGDQKNIYLVGDDYSFEMTGTDDGSMDYVVREFDDEGNTTREITYENIKLSDGCKYYSYVPEAVNHSSTLFDLTDDKGNVISSTTETEEDPKPAILASGKCGEDAFWKLFDNGILYIYGKGWLSYNFPWGDYDDKIFAVEIEEGVTNIGSWAFDDCRNLTSVIIPEGVTSIGISAFSGCSSLTSVTIPKGVISIGEHTFDECSSLTSVTIPEGVTSIDQYAFKNCSNLISLTIPEGVTSIGKSAFSGCSSLTSVTILEGMTSIGWYAFENCSSLISVIIPEGVTSIGWYAFENCCSLTSVAIPGSVTEMGSQVFSHCISLTSAIISEGVTNIGIGTFGGCSNLTSVTIPEGVTNIGEGVFSGCTNLTRVILPSSLTEINEYVFENCNSLISVMIPEGVTGIGNRAFLRCSNLTSVTIPEGVTNIGEGVFSGCSNLTSVIIPEGVTRISNSAFSGCSSLTSVTIPEGVTSIGKYAFMDCSSLTSVTIPEGVTSIDKYAFMNCSSLIRVAIPLSVTDIEYFAFKGRNDQMNIYYAGTEAQWDEINTVTLSKHFVTIHYNSDGISLPGNDPTNVPEMTEKPIETSKPPETTKNPVRTTRPLEIDHPSGTNRPSETGSYPSVTGNPESDKNTILTDTHTKSVYKVMGNGTVQYIKPIVAVSEISIPAVVAIDNTTYKVTSIVANAFKNNKQITKVVIGKNIKTVEKSAFSGCTKLKTVAMGNNVTTIANKAFYKCSALKKITIPASVTVIGKKAFYGCKKLKFIAIKTKKIKSKSVGEQTFKGIHKKAIIKVPKKKKKAYQKWLRKKGITKSMKIK